MDIGCVRTIGEWARGLSFRERVAVLALITLISCGTLISFDHLILGEIIQDMGGEPADLHVYQERAQTIIDGNLLYRDVHTETPPLVNYLLVPPQLLGGSALLYSIYFSLWNFLGGLMLYLGLRDWNDYRAFIAGTLFILSPFGLVESTLGVEDESLIAVVSLLPLILLIQRCRRLSALSIGVGVWTKMFAGLFYPLLFLRTRDWGERGLHIAIIAGVTAAVVLPFLILCPDQFVWFLKFYLLGVEGRESGGISFWHFLQMGGVGIPGFVGMALTAGALLLAVYIGHRKGLTTWQSALLILLAFFVFYPKIHLGYYLIPMGVLAVWGATDKGIVLRILLIFVPLAAAVLFSESPTDLPVLDYGWGWMAGLVLSLLGTLILVETVRRALSSPNFMDGPSGEDR
ncbi:MAG: hypothetical protein ACLFPN_02905 [Methanomassiliicoccales archaeon]